MEQRLKDLARAHKKGFIPLFLRSNWYERVSVDPVEFALKGRAEDVSFLWSIVLAILGFVEITIASMSHHPFQGIEAISVEVHGWIGFALMFFVIILHVFFSPDEDKHKEGYSIDFAQALDDVDEMFNEQDEPNVSNDWTMGSYAGMKQQVLFGAIREILTDTAGLMIEAQEYTNSESEGGASQTETMENKAKETKIWDLFNRWRTSALNLGLPYMADKQFFDRARSKRARAQNQVDNEVEETPTPEIPLTSGLDYIA